jgi:hypothetical protein
MAHPVGSVNIPLAGSEPAPTDGFEPAVLKYGWPGVITQWITGATDTGNLADLDHPTVPGDPVHQVVSCHPEAHVPLKGGLLLDQGRFGRLQLGDTNLTLLSRGHHLLGMNRRFGSFMYPAANRFSSIRTSLENSGCSASWAALRTSFLFTRCKALSIDFGLRLIAAATFEQGSRSRTQRLNAVSSRSVKPNVSAPRRELTSAATMSAGSLLMPDWSGRFHLDNLSSSFGSS